MTTTGGPQAERSGRTLLAVLGAVLAVLVIVGIIFVVIGRSEEADPAPAARGTTSPTTATLPSVRPATFHREARRATRDGMPVLLPSDLPPGWSVSAAAYDAGAGTWTMSFVTPHGALDLVQEQGATVADLVAAHAAGADAGETIDLSRWQSGNWASYAHADVAALGRTLKSTSILLVGTDVDDATALAKRLLTMEVDTGGEGD